MNNGAHVGKTLRTRHQIGIEGLKRVQEEGTIEDVGGFAEKFSKNWVAIVVFSGSKKSSSNDNNKSNHHQEYKL